MNKTKSSGNATYRTSPWSEQVRSSRSPLWKSATYAILRGLWDRQARKGIDVAVLPEAVSKVISERGYPLQFRRRWATSGFDVGISTILVQGTGNGWDVVSWASLRPKAIIAVDLFSFQSWPEIRSYCSQEFGTTVEFVTSPLEANFGLKPCSIDLVVSDAVYEHCEDLAAVMRETHRILRSGGRVYANYGPLWYCAAGDHFSGRESLESSYNHIVLTAGSYAEYVQKQRRDKENFQDGARYIELDLFSRLVTNEYIQIYQSTGFTIEDLWLEVSARAVEFKRQYALKFNEVLNRVTKNVSANDLLIKAHHLRMRK